MMNGIGLVQNLDGLEHFLVYKKRFVSNDGQIILDSSDIRYMFDIESKLDDYSKIDYYGELEYQPTYKNYNFAPFRWLFIDFDCLSYFAIKYGWNIELIYEDKNFNYLVKLTKNQH